jgi:hypothetical protein
MKRLFSTCYGKPLDKMVFRAYSGNGRAGRSRFINISRLRELKLYSGKGYIMSRLFQVAFTVIFLLLTFSCATNHVASSAPFWADDETSMGDNYILFTATGKGEDKERALENLGENLSDKILIHMGFSQEDFHDLTEERAYLTSLFTVLSDDKGLLPEGAVEDLSWFRDEDRLGVAARYRYSRNKYENDKELMRFYLSGSSDFSKLMIRSGELEDYPFSAFLKDMDAAQNGQDWGGLLQGYLKGQAFDSAVAHLEKVETPLLKGADKVYLGARRSWTYDVYIPLAPEDTNTIPWSIEMIIPEKGGESNVLDITLPSDETGKTVLSYPFPSGEGEGRILFSLIPGEYDDLLSDFTTLEEEKGQALIRAMNRFSLEQSFPVLRDRRVLKTALIIEDRDVAGRILDSRATEEAVYSLLKEADYSVEKVDFDLETIKGMSELEMVREFNSHYSNNYDIILFCEAGIRDFTQKGDLFQVNAGAVLYEADLWEHRINVIEDLSSSVSGKEPSRLVTSAFYQLGKDIADACFKLNSN